MLLRMHSQLQVAQSAPNHCLLPLTCTVRSSRPHCRLSSGVPVMAQQAAAPCTQAAGVRWQGHSAACRTDCTSGCSSAWQLSCKARMLPTSGCLNCSGEAAKDGRTLGGSWAGTAHSSLAAPTLGRSSSAQ